MIIHSKPLPKMALANLYKQYLSKNKGGKFMYNYKFDDLFTENTKTVVDNSKPEFVTQSPLLDLDPSRAEEICGKKYLE